ncbi:hypothetical protein GUITHDRAFT_120688 [Guillardia theta CCMP2712]|uniref:Uncharacterized protein n=1 Tax=Guillardia theta (strain CCMP2712) TaxID=905079 RepID=L1IA40_GUITC|nr:hypothetical protein GUITHDRAFT_120688 [Guillardia theta CCMP2712]EKX33121.1 hypothetical protein GUITHDRAFT_120688 [Guillardia theta CCMP2712]|eukprot:XP_005820101.1 hypothetical protein GUITHDRAFT_120688 [Guillardia theta CCMP2712]
MRNSVEGTCRLRGGFDNPNPIYHHGTTDDESEKEQNADALDEKKILESVLKHVRPKPAPPPEKPKEKTEEEEQQEEFERSILAKILEPGALSRLDNVRYSNPQLAKSIQNKLLSMAREGRILDKVSEDTIVSQLKTESKRVHKKSQFIYKRKKTLLDNVGITPEEAERVGVNVSDWNIEMTDSVSSSQLPLDLDDDEEPADGGMEDLPLDASNDE